ncbi:hypothetical protein J5N97_021020 [Dioscorea zingiberensis]|uniref:Protein kinase domain-containing protein n=1 Tax=Dioscorea zingiberensis TaxID=325984 RepID=A0A9D5CGW8_9LILI|nr:hypothetical protein J5N97_021020 [Dioscorea zingiberensis]
MARSFSFLALVVVCLTLVTSSHQLLSSQSQVLQQLRKQLEYPKQLDAWNGTKDLCYVPFSPSFTVSCEGESVTELKIVGDRLAKVSSFDGHAVPDHTLSESFVVDSFFTTLSRLPGLKVVILVSLGIWGPLPDKIHRLESLEVLDLSSNFLYGSIPPKISTMRNRLKGPLSDSIGRAKSLTDLALSNNKISGEIPDLSGLTKLDVLDLRDNELDSGLPEFPKGLVTILLSNNSLSGEIPEKYGSLSWLQHLDLSFNALEGIPPASLFSLPNISYLNLASNLLSGSLPSSLTCSSQLGFVDISANKLTGGLPSCLSSNSDKRVVKFTGNCLSIDPQHQHDVAYCREFHAKGKESKRRGIVLLIAVVGGLSSELLANARYISQATKLGTQVLPTYRVFSLEELKEATKNFDRLSYIGEGSMGKLYKGRLENGNYVAIRCLALFRRYSIRNLKLRLDLLSKLRHPHLVCLLGHCIDGPSDDSSVNRVYLIYEYLPNGNLRNHLSEHNLEKAMNWSDRLAVLIGIAKAVHFLHTGVIPGFINNRLKTNNILLDEHYRAKLSDYGLSIITEEIDKHEARAEGQKHAQSKPPPSETINLEDDVYTFGSIILEVLVGTAVSDRDASSLSELAMSLTNQDERKWALDPFVYSTSSQESLSIVTSMTNKCLSLESSERPSLEDVLWNLQYAAQVQATADGEQRSDVASQA